MTKFEFKKVQGFLILLTLAVFLASLYLQYIAGLHPCALCLMQRLCVFLLLIVMGFRLYTLKRAHFISLLQILLAAAGMFFSLRQLWLQSLPAGEASSCLPGLDILVHYFPWQTVVKALFLGTGECAEVSWTLLGISLAGWGGIYFAIVLFFSLYLYSKTSDSTQ